MGVVVQVIAVLLALASLLLCVRCIDARALPYGISKDSSVIVVGARFRHDDYAHNHDDDGARQQKVRVFQRNGSSYDVTELVAPPAAAQLLFGHSVAVSESGETIVVGAPSRTALTSPSALTVSRATPKRASTLHSALSVSPGANRIVIGETLDQRPRSSAMITTRDNGRVFVIAETLWTAELLHELADASELAISDAGRAFVYFGTHWRSLVELKPPPLLRDQCSFVRMATFGSAVDVADLPSSSAYRPQRQMSVVAVGDPNGVLGSAYVFYGRQWHSVHAIRPLDASDPILAGNFGAAVALSASAKVLAVGSVPPPPEAFLHRSAVYLRHGPDWGSETMQRLLPTSTSEPSSKSPSPPPPTATAARLQFGSLALSDLGGVAVVHIRQPESPTTGPDLTTAASSAALVLYGEKWSQQIRVAHVTEPPDFDCFLSLDASVLVVGSLHLAR